MVNTRRARKGHERIAQIKQLHAMGITNPHEIAQRLNVNVRTVQRYEHELAGGRDRRVIIYPKYKPLVLEHLRKYPHLRISAWQLTRAIRLHENRHKAVFNALQSLEREGLVRHEIAIRQDRNYSTPLKVVLWSIAPDQVEVTG